MATVKSAKAKARRLQDHIRDTIIRIFPELDDGESVVCAIMGEAGEDIKLNYKARMLLPVSFEAKANKTFAVYGPYDQAKNNSNGYEPVLVIRGDRKKALAVVDLEHYLELMYDRSKIPQG